MGVRARPCGRCQLVPCGCSSCTCRELRACWSRTPRLLLTQRDGGPAAACAQVPGAEVTVWRVRDPVKGDDHAEFDEGVLDAPVVTVQVRDR